MQYDGLGRRIVKAVTNSATLDATYHYYYNGQQMVETRKGLAAFNHLNAIKKCYCKCGVFDALGF